MLVVENTIAIWNGRLTLTIRANQVSANQVFGKYSQRTEQDETETPQSTQHLLDIRFRTDNEATINLIDSCRLGEVGKIVLAHEDGDLQGQFRLSEEPVIERVEQIHWIILTASIVFA